MEYGMRPPAALATWMVWRKWLYDLDNRAAQETGYLFEPILAAAIGGVPYAATKSPVRRTDDPNRGRQVDCLDERDAYEFKMRVSLAASGQGRFAEELSFARDCQASGYVPILLVLDPTPSVRLDDLVAAYRQYNGAAYIGPAAWEHIERKAGPTMGRFVATYIQAPLQQIRESLDILQPVRLIYQESRITIEVGETHFSIPRHLPGINSNLIEEKSELEPE